MAVAAVASTALTVATTWSAQTSGEKLFARTGRDLGTGLLANTVALLGWDAIYYWNHRFNHESRWLWAMHVVHHSSERYNLSTALRQPVAEGVTMSVPYGLLALAGVRAERHRERPRAQPHLPVLDPHRGGPLHRVAREGPQHPVAPRVHHGSNSRYLDRNHGSILIVWDKLFGTFEERTSRRLRTDEEHRHPQPAVIATHEWREIARDVAGSQTWRDRWSFLLRGPGGRTTATGPSPRRATPRWSPRRPPRCRLSDHPGGPAPAQNAYEPNRPHATNAARSSSTTLTAIICVSPRRAWTTAAPTIVSASPVAAAARGPARCRDGGQDEAEGAEHLDGADALDGAGREVLDPAEARLGERRLRAGELHGAGGEEREGEHDGDDPEHDVHGDLQGGDFSSCVNS